MPLTNLPTNPISRLRDDRIALFRLSEEVMAHRPFKKPVFMKLNSLGNYQARSAWEALEYLDMHWPHEHSARYIRAKRLCQDAIDGLIRPEVARAAVVEAARDAGLLEKGWLPNADGSLSGYRAVNQNAKHVAA